MINTDNLIETHAQLDAFAKHHRNLGHKEAIEVVRTIWNQVEKQAPKTLTPEQESIHQGVLKGIRMIGEALDDKFLLF